MTKEEFDDILTNFVDYNVLKLMMERNMFLDIGRPLLAYLFRQPEATCLPINDVVIYQDRTAATDSNRTAIKVGPIASIGCLPDDVREHAAASVDYCTKQVTHPDKDTYLSDVYHSFVLEGLISVLNLLKETIPGNLGCVWDKDRALVQQQSNAPIMVLNIKRPDDMWEELCDLD